MRLNLFDLPDDINYMNGMELLVLKDVSKGSSEALLAEARILRNISSNHVVRCLGVVDERRCRALVLEYCDRGNLRQVVQEILQGVGLMNPVGKLLAQLCAVLYVGSAVHVTHCQRDSVPAMLLWDAKRN